MQLSTKLPWELAQTKWSSTLNPIIAIPMLSGNAIEQIKLTANVPMVVNHGLQRTPQGWFLTDNNSNAVIWRSSKWNTLTIPLTASANTIINIWVF